MRRLTHKEIAAIRMELVGKQLNICPLCQCEFKPGDIIHLDHNHKTGIIRAALHGVCNRALGKVERWSKMTQDQFKFVENVPGYLHLHSQDQTGLLHPTKLTTDELKARRKRRRKKG